MPKLPSASASLPPSSATKSDDKQAVVSVPSDWIPLILTGQAQKAFMHTHALQTKKIAGLSIGHRDQASHLELYTDSSGQSLDGYAIVNGRRQRLGDDAIVAIAVTLFARMQQQDDVFWETKARNRELFLSADEANAMRSAARLPPQQNLHAPVNAALCQPALVAPTRPGYKAMKADSLAASRPKQPTTFAAYLEKMAKPGSYGTDVELFALAKILKRPIQVMQRRLSVDNDTWRAVATYPNAPDPGTSKPLVLMLSYANSANDGANHYEWLDGKTQEIQQVPRDGNCMFSSVAAAMNAQSPEKESGFTAAQLRAQAVTWLQKNGKKAELAEGVTLAQHALTDARRLV